ncbi:MAG: DUF3592 domain-containing protein [Mycobacterium sp.]|nr:DUF3592 domain-containing protein [Mycobacterium sp.]
MSISGTVVMVTIAGLVWAIALRRLLAARRARSWPTAPAVAVAIRTMKVENRGRSDGVVYAPLLRFHTPGRGQVESTPDYWSSRPIAQVGEEVTVRYDPADPERLFVVGMRASGDSLLMALLVAVPVLLTAVLYLGR